MGKKALIALLVVGLLLTGCSGKSAASKDITGALNLVLGTSDKPSVFSSYHIELTLDTPQLNDDSTAVVNQTTQISADVEGANVHIIQTDPGATESKEGYIIGDTEYKMVNGQKEDTMGKIALSWAMWPLQVVVPYSYSAYYAKKTGTDKVDGRDAAVYTFDSKDASAASQNVMSSVGLDNLTNASGTVWIDNETGGMLKLDMTYVETLSNSDNKAVGDGTGNIKLEVSQVNQAHVVEPQ